MLILYLVGFYLVINVFGALIEKIRIPKIYAALFLGVLLSEISAITSVVNTTPVKLLSQAGMFALLFLLGYGLNIKKIKRQGRLIVKVTATVILTESIVGISILHFFFNVDWALAAVISVSFATVGEIALLPLLKEFKILKTNLGQTILGIAILDDIVEIIAFILLITVLGGINPAEVIFQMMPLFSIAVGVIFSGLSKRHEEEPTKLDKTIDFLAIYVLGPVFFFTAGTKASLHVLYTNFFMILVFTLAIKATKVLSTYLVSHKQLGTKKSLVLGVSLGIKFSTSIVILILLLQRGLITSELFSILLGIKIIFKFVVPILLSIMLSKWHLELVEAD